MSKPIEIYGCTPKQKAYLKILWKMESWEDIWSFIGMQDDQDQIMCQTLINTVFWAKLDDVKDVSEAAGVLEQFTLAGGAK